jgi:hypothetical protein
MPNPLCTGYLPAIISKVRMETAKFGDDYMLINKITLAF